MKSNLKIQEKISLPPKSEAQKNAQLIAAIMQVVERGQGFEELSLFDKLARRFGFRKEIE